MLDYTEEARNLADDIRVLVTSGLGSDAKEAAVRLIATALRVAYRRGWVDSGNEARRLLVPPYHIPDHFVEWAGEVDEFLGELKRQQ